MSDERIKRCTSCGGWTYMSEQDVVRQLMGDQLICQSCIKKGKNNAA